MLIFNNLLINANSDRYQPFLINIVSGRRRLLNDKEYANIKKMVDDASFDDEALMLFNKLVNEKQFYTDEMRKEIEMALFNAGCWEKDDLYADNYSFSIELTRLCNMDCSFCYTSLRKRSKTMTKEYIDSIFLFYDKYADDKNKISDTPYIRITGGEPLLNNETAKLVKYIADKWKNSKLILFTNGLNLLKYYKYLPIKQLMEVHISLDGPPSIHAKRRYPSNIWDSSIYERIIQGIQRLLEDQIDVKIKTTLDCKNYLYIDELRQLLKEKGILNSRYCEHIFGITIDYCNKLDLMEEVNSIQDIRMIEKHLGCRGLVASTYPSLAVLNKILMRELNEPYLPQCSRCRNEFLANYYFSCNGRVYHCDCIEDDIGVVGEFYPEIKLYKDEVKRNHNRTIFANKKCKTCAYSYVCLGGCPLSARAKQEEMSCGIFANEDILNNLEFDHRIIAGRD